MSASAAEPLPCIQLSVQIVGGDEISNRVVDKLRTQLSTQFHIMDGTAATTHPTLSIVVLQCTAGSRWGRACCAELGMGWVVLEIQWKLTSSSTGDDTVACLAQGCEKRRDAGNMGFGDFCSSDVGERALFDDMVPKLATIMAEGVKQGLLKQTT